MNAIWSFWTKPYQAERRLSWHREWHHWLAWGLSLYAARQHYPHTRLVTDDEGARILIDQLQLPFENVSTALNGIANENPNWWALGKIEAYRRQRTPFVHIDTDVFLWKRLRPELENADVFAQNPERIDFGGGYYSPVEFEASIGWPRRGWLPEEWTWYRKSKLAPRAQCCGIFGGCQIDFINYFAETALRIVRHPSNRPGWRELPGKHMLLIEQYLLNAMIEYHLRRQKPPFRLAGIRHVFPEIEDAFNFERITEAGFTHLAAGAKQDARVARDLERRVERDLPEHYERCARYVRASGGFRWDYTIPLKGPVVAGLDLRSLSHHKPDRNGPAMGSATCEKKAGRVARAS
jgi:hypothetical protein